MTQTHKTLVISAILFLFIFCFFGLPFTQWWFNGDDFSGLALGKCMQTWNGFWSHFIEGNVNKYFYPSHHKLYTPYGIAISHKLYFFDVYYRPIHCAYLAFSYWLFGLNAYAYYLVSVLLHAINTTVLFNMLLWFSSRFWALFFALLFAFHPQIGFRFGAPANFQYYLNVLLLMLTIAMLKKYLDHPRYVYLFFSAIFFAVAIFTRETAIIFPALLFVGSWLYQKTFSWAPITHSFTALGYLIVRILLYPFHKLFQGGAGGNGLLYNPNDSLVSTLFSKITSRFNEVLVCLYDSLSLSWLPYGHKFLRLSLLLIAALFIAILFWRNKHKFLLLFLSASYLLMLWPSLFGAYSPRYFYEASPFLMAFLATLASTTTLKTGVKKKALLLFCCSLMCLYAFFTYTNLRCREAKLFTMKNAFSALTTDQRITSANRHLCFLAFPTDGFGTGIEQAAWLLLTPPNNPVYYDPSTMLTQNDANVLINAGWYMHCAPHYTRNYFTITKTPTKIRLSSIDPQKINFQQPSDYLSLGTKVIHQTALINAQKVVTDFTIVFDAKYQILNPLIITWDYEKQTFIVHE